MTLTIAMKDIASRGFSTKALHSLLLLVITVGECSGHLVLTYPPPRKYPLDFLDNTRTMAPCGMPRRPEPVHYTDIPAGSSLQVVWDVAYPHRGGMFIELTNNNDDVIQRYPQTDYALAEDISQLNYTIQLPAQACTNCTLRMVKRAQEWGNNYLFWSCSDVNLVTTTMNTRERCSNHGVYDGIRCICDRTYDGTLCQFQNECQDTLDCSDHGVCLDTQSTRYPRLQCFCIAGWFGRHCEKESPVKSRSEIDLSMYKQQHLRDDYSVYHRILTESQELEVVLQVKSVTWIALGWRPKGQSVYIHYNYQQNVISLQLRVNNNIRSSNDTNKTCQRFPTFSGINERNISSDDVKPPETVGPIGEGEPVPDSCDGSCSPSSGCLYSVTWSHDPKTQRLNFSITAQLASDEYFGLGFSTDRNMPDSDIVVGWVRSDGTTFLSDRWATAHQQPEEDAQNDLMQVSGQTLNGVTVMNFSRALDTMDPRDLALNVTECIYLLTSRGQKTDDGRFFYHMQNKMSSTSKYCFTNCHVKTSLEPQGQPIHENKVTVAPVPTRTDDPNGQTESTLNPCDGFCNPTLSCLYDVTWTHDPKTQRVNFTITVQLGSNEYFGLGFSKDQNMPDSDIVVGWVRSDGTTFLSDRWATTHQQPEEDIQNDLLQVSGQTLNGVTVINFSRALDTMDPRDLALNVTECIYLLTSRGQKTDDGRFFYHMQNKMSSTSKYCFTNCRVKASPEPLREPFGESSLTITPEPVGESSPNGQTESTQNPCDGFCNPTLSCLYDVTWTHDPKTQRVNFAITVQLGSDEYFGLGFSKDQNMPDSDIVVGWVRGDGTTYLSDRWATAHQHPEEDVQNDLMLISGQVMNGITIVNFSRALDTLDSRDLALNVTECIYLLTARGSKTDDGQFIYHRQNKRSSAFNYCFTNCPVTAFSEPQSEPVGTSEPTAEAEPHGENLHPMDCIDVIIGFARGNLSRIGDYYTRDRSTPLLDEVYDGSDSLTAALGYEDGEFTTVLFRRKLESNDPADWSIVNGLMHVVWARGQRENDVYHSPDSAFEKNEMSDRTFYRPDVLKYHGTHTDHRGVVSFNFYGSTDSLSQSASSADIQATPALQFPASSSVVFTAISVSSTSATPSPDVTSTFVPTSATTSYGPTATLYGAITTSSADFISSSVPATGVALSPSVATTSASNSTPVSSLGDIVTSSLGTAATSALSTAATSFSTTATPLLSAAVIVSNTATTSYSTTATPLLGTAAMVSNTATTSFSTSATPLLSAAVMVSNTATTSFSTSATPLLGTAAMVSNTATTSYSTSATPLLGTAAMVSNTAATSFSTSATPLLGTAVMVSNTAATSFSTSATPLLGTAAMVSNTAATSFSTSATPLLGTAVMVSNTATTSYSTSATPLLDTAAMVSNTAATSFSTTATPLLSTAAMINTAAASYSTAAPPPVGTAATPTPIFTASSVPAVTSLSTAATSLLSTTTATIQAVTPSPTSVTSTSPAVTTSQTASVIVVVPSAIKIVSLNYSTEYADLSSVKSQETKSTIENELDRILTDRIPSFDSVVVTGFRSGSLIVDTDIRVKARAEETVEVKQNVERTMRLILDAGSLAGYTLDQKYLVFSQPRTEPVSGGENREQSLGVAEIVIITLSVALFVAIVCVLVVYKVRSARRSKSYGNNRTGSDNSDSSSHSQSQHQSRAGSKESSRSAGRPIKLEDMHESQNRPAYDNHGFEPSQSGSQTTFIA